MSQEDICCSICLDNIDISMNVIKTECKHCFHSNCFLQNAAHNGFNCPMCRNELAEIPKDEDDEDDEDDDEEEEDEEDEDFVLRGARWLMMRAEGDEIDEDDTDSESISSDDSDDSEECEYFRGEYTDEPNISIAEITQKMIARGISFKDLVALYVLPHHENTADRMEFNQTFLQKKEDVIHAIVMATP